MLDHKIDKIFVGFFWLGLLVIALSFFYDQWFVISVSLGIILMLMYVVRAGLRFRSSDTFTSFLNKNKKKIVYRAVLTLVIIAVITYLWYAKLYDVEIQFYNLKTAPLFLNWWAPVLLGIILGVVILALIVKITGMGTKPSAKSHKKPGKPKVEKRIRPGKKSRINFYKLLTMLAYLLSVICILVLLFLNKKAKISLLDWYGWITLAVLTGLFASFSFLKMYKAYRKKHVGEKKGEAENIKVIKRSVIAKASKYKTDIDRLYELVNQRGKLTLSEVSKGFGITKEMAEEWGKILEEHDLIMLNYPPFGEVELCRKR